MSAHEKKQTEKVNPILHLTSFPSSKYRIHLKRIFQSPLFIIRSSSGNADLLFDLFKQNTVFYGVEKLITKHVCQAGTHQTTINAFIWHTPNCPFSSKEFQICLMTKFSVKYL